MLQAPLPNPTREPAASDSDGTAISKVRVMTFEEIMERKKHVAYEQNKVNPGDRELTRDHLHEGDTRHENFSSRKESKRHKDGPRESRQSEDRGHDDGEKRGTCHVHEMSHSK